MNETISRKDYIIATCAIIFLTAGLAYWLGTNTPEAAENASEPPDAANNYLMQEDIVKADQDAAPDEIRNMLQTAFDEGRLYRVAGYDVPFEGVDQLVLATPIISEPNEPVNCDVRGHSYCGLYRTGTEGTRLLVWGSRMAGFSGVESYVEPHHAIIATAWSMLNFTSIERHQLDIQTGELVPKLLIEIDVGDNFAELQARGEGKYVSVYVSGTYDRGRLIPESLEIRDAEKNVRAALGSVELRELADIAKADIAEGGDEIVKPIFALPSDEDIETRTLHVELYGRPYILDVTNQTLYAEG